MAITDTGPGIPEDIRARITQPYVRGPGDGHGLGLAIVNGLCLRLGWGFEVESEVGEGTTARIRFEEAAAEQERHTGMSRLCLHGHLVDGAIYIGTICVALRRSRFDLDYTQQVTLSSTVEGVA